MRHIALAAPAKINLFLHVRGRRADGYHQLQTLFQFLDFADTVQLSLRHDGRLCRLSGAEGVPEAQDLAVRAALLLQQHSGTALGADISITKRIPMGAGLGGGSSNAASVLLGLNRLWGLHLPLAELAQLGLRLGADVPVFVHGRAAWAEGVGEQLTAVTLPEPFFTVLLPDAHVPTAAIFAAPELCRSTPAITLADHLAGHSHNDCTPVTASRYPPVAEALAGLNRYGKAYMSGTGAAVFAAFANAQAAQAALEGCNEANLRGFVAKGSNLSAAHNFS